MLKVISDIMAVWYLMVNAFIIAIYFYNSEFFFDVNHKQSITVLSSFIQFESWNDVFKVISDIMSQLYAMINAKKMNCALMFIISNHNARINLINWIEYELFQVISDINGTLVNLCWCQEYKLFSEVDHEQSLWNKCS